MLVLAHLLLTFVGAFAASDCPVCKYNGTSSSLAASSLLGQALISCADLSTAQVPSCWKAVDMNDTLSFQGGCSLCKNSDESFSEFDAVISFQDTNLTCSELKDFVSLMDDCHFMNIPADIQTFCGCTIASPSPSPQDGPHPFQLSNPVLWGLWCLLFLFVCGSGIYCVHFINFQHDHRQAVIARLVQESVRQRQRKQEARQQHLRQLVLEQLFPNNNFQQETGRQGDAGLTIPHSTSCSSLQSVRSLSSVVCPICLESLKEGCHQTIVSGALCSHEFHRDCLLHWLVQHNECPSCRQALWDPRQYADVKIELEVTTARAR